MKIDKIIFASDESDFLQFWKIQAKVSKEILGLDPILFIICEEESDFYPDGNGTVKKIKKSNLVLNTGAQAAIGRMYFTRYFPDSVCLISDIDLLTINREYIESSSKNFSDDDFIIFDSDAYELDRPEVYDYLTQSHFPFVQQLYSYHFNAAKGKIFDKILGTDCTFDEYLLKHISVGDGSLFWGVDEFYFSDCINNKSHGIEIRKIIRGISSPWMVDRRIERHNFPVELKFSGEIEAQRRYGTYDEKKLEEGYYIDVNCCRPYNEYKNEIDRVVEIALKINKNNKMEDKKEKRIEELMLVPRMFYADYNQRNNQLKGLKMLIDEFINQDSVIVEVGSFSGVSSELFALHCKEIYCVDLWDPYWEITDKQKIIFAEYVFDKLLQQYTNVHKVKNNSVEASKQFEDNSLDFVYIDAAHDYDNVRQDILTWLPKIKKGGHIGGHDYRYDPNIGVYEAVNDIFVDDYKIITFPDSSFIVKV